MKKEFREIYSYCELCGREIDKDALQEVGMCSRCNAEYREQVEEEFLERQERERQGIS